MKTKLFVFAMLFALLAAACSGDDGASVRELGDDESSESASSGSASSGSGSASSSSESASSESASSESTSSASASEEAADEPEATDDVASDDDDGTVAPADDAESEEAADVDEAADVEECPTITLITHDSFFLSEGTLQAFSDETCISVEQLAGGDAGQLVSSAILTKDNPNADVLFGIDNTFLQRGLDADLFLPYASPALANIDPSLILDPENRVTPIDFGDVCANYWIEALPGDVPTSLDDLLDPVNEGQFVTQNPETSSPGFAFLLATIAKYGDDWEDFWQGLVDNGVTITAGWEDAYYGAFAGYGGPSSIVMSYASSPPAEVLFAAEPIDEPPTGVLFDSCYRQIEFAGILDGTEYPDAAAQLIDFMLGTTYQEDIPLNMFVYPVNPDAVLPPEFVEFGPLAENPLSLSPEEIEANREAWTERWVEIVLG
ncbi:MAG: thiamine ABC transporter substrate-binding protein [Actinomycetota bacterium]